MWTCPHCGRIFAKAKQSHTCQKIPLEQHFQDKPLAQELFEYLVARLNKDVGSSTVVSIPCCIHLFGQYDFLAALPKKDRLEVRFALNRVLKSARLKQSVPLSQTSYKNCLDIWSLNQIDPELIGWIKESYNLKQTPLTREPVLV